MGAPAPSIEIRVEPVMVQRATAVRMMGVGETSFDTYIAPHLRAVRRGRLVLYPVEELRRFAREAAAPAPADELLAARRRRRRS